MNILKHAGIVDGAPEIPSTSELYATPDNSSFVIAKTEGLFEICKDLGDDVKTGDILARVHYLEEPERDPTPLVANGDGILICRHMPGLIQRGDCAAVIAEKWTRDDVV